MFGQYASNISEVFRPVDFHVLCTWAHGFELSFIYNLLSNKIQGIEECELVKKKRGIYTWLGMKLNILFFQFNR